MGGFYTLIVARILLSLFAAALMAAPPPPKEVEPPEEDETVKTKEYTFNPVQAADEIRVGNYYMKKGSLKAARQRFEEATRWNPQSAEAWLRLAQVSEKLKDPKTIRAAYTKYLELEPEAKDAAAIRKKLGK
jgi:Tfp pilus assembly protein PilF